MSEPFLSVVLITYNHHNYIKRAIESVLMQDVSFPIEILVGEDESSDGTRELVLEYAEKYPNSIKPVLHRRADVVYINGKPTGRWNLLDTLCQAQGKYVAYLEGDDYWVSPNKLQIQVDFLESNPGTVLSFHAVREEFGESQQKFRVRKPAERRKEYYPADILKRCFVSSNSVVFRNHLLSEYPDWIWKTPMGDWPLFILLAQHGSFAYIDEVLSVYNLHSGGVWSGLGKQSMYESILQTFEILHDHFSDAKVVEAGLYYAKSRLYWYKGEHLFAFANFLKSLFYKPTFLAWKLFAMKDERSVDGLPVLYV